MMTMTEQLNLPLGDADVADSDVRDLSQAEKASMVPKPVGYHMLCAIPEISDTYSSGIIKAEQTKHIEEHSTVVLYVAAMGDMCYQDTERFPTGPWCKVGDFVLVRAYAGTRIKIHNKEWRIINDDSVEAVVDDPRGITRV